MPSGLPARVVVVCSLIFGVAIARADRRQVAVIDLSGDENTTKLAVALNPVLVAHPDLQPINNAAIVAELYGAFEDDDFDRTRTAGNAKETAQSSLANYRFEIAQQNAVNGQDELRQVKPTAQSILLYAQLSFLRGQALLGIPRQTTDAPYYFALAYRLDPSFVPDAARYLPDVVQAYDAAKKRWTGKGTLQVIGHGRLWLDGKDVGVAPMDVEVDAGPHVVWLSGADRFTLGAQTPIVEQGKTVKVEIEDKPADLRTKIRRARAALRYAPDPTARAAAMKTIADLVEVGDALLLLGANGKVIQQRWNAGTRAHLALGLQPGFSELSEVGKTEKPLDLLKPFAPPKKIVVPPDDGPKPLVDERRWYQKRQWQATLVVGIAAALIGGYYIYQVATSDDAHLGTGVDPLPTGRFQW